MSPGLCVTHPSSILWVVSGSAFNYLLLLKYRNICSAAFWRIGHAGTIDTSVGVFSHPLLKAIKLRKNSSFFFFVFFFLILQTECWTSDLRHGAASSLCVCLWCNISKRHVPF